MRDMTSGNIPRQMLSFTLPILLSNLFQQLYNVTDTVLVGKYIGKQALAAVGSAGAVMNILLFLIVGVSLGASVLIAQFYGGKEPEKVKKELGTALSAGFVFTLLVMAAALMFSGAVLKQIKTPDDVLPMADVYLKTMAAGLCFTFFYNMLASALRALGDAKAPVCFLVLSALMNIGLDLVFIRTLHMGVMGAALATVIAQATAAGLCGVYIFLKVPLLRLGVKDLAVDHALLRQTVRFSGVYALQQCVLYLGVLVVQGTVNTLGVDAMAAYSAVTKIDSFSLMPGDSLAAALSTFVAQNKGAGQKKRIHSGLKCALIIGLCYCGALALALPFAAGGFLRLFVGGEPSIIQAGTAYLRWMAFLYPLTAICNSFQGLFRGLGRMRITLGATLVQIPIRALLASLLAGSFGLVAIPMATGTGWLCMILFSLFFYHRYRKETTR